MQNSVIVMGLFPLCPHELHTAEEATQRCFENIQQIYRTPFPRNTSGWLLLIQVTSNVIWTLFWGLQMTFASKFNCPSCLFCLWEAETIAWFCDFSQMQNSAKTWDSKLVLGKSFQYYYSCSKMSFVQNFNLEQWQNLRQGSHICSDMQQLLNWKVKEVLKNKKLNSSDDISLLFCNRSSLNF